jgi:hypothetical protein
LMARLGTQMALLLGELDRGSDFASAASRLGIPSAEFEQSVARAITPR